MNLKELKELIELVAEKEFAEFEIERSGFRLRIKRQADTVTHYVTEAPTPSYGPAPAPPAEAPMPVRPAPVAPAVETPAAVVEADLHIIKSPIVGTFYRSASPTAQPFVKPGDYVEVGKVLCIVEAMKLMNEIESDVAGEVVKAYVENGQPVEYGQPLFGIRK